MSEEMITRSFEIRNVDDEKREVSGIAVPYGQVINAGGYSESFDRGAIASVDGTKLFWNHDEIIGKVVRGKDTDEGFEITAVISKTTRGEEAYTLLKDGVVDKFSVGFIPVEHRMDGDTVVRTKVDLREVSLVPFPAYSQASVLSVRSDEAETARNEGITSNKEVFELTENNIAPEVAELREAVSMLERKVEVLSTEDKEVGVQVPEFRSFGEYAKAVAKGDENAEAVYRAYTGGVHADVALKNGWAADAIRLLDNGRKTINAFSKAVLPAEGMTVEYGVLDDNTIDVDVQVAEGDTLAFGKVSVTSALANVKTFGGYTTLSRQEIERGSVNILDLSFRAMAIEYAKRTEAEVRAAVTAATGTSTATLSADSAAGWLGLVADSAGELDDEGLSLDFILVSPDVFKRLAVLVGADGRPLLSYGSGANTVGNANVAALTANINGVPVYRDGSLAANTCIAANKQAVKVFESAGAPFRLGPDDHITNLTKDYSVYGYLAVAVEMPKGIVKADVDLV